MQRQDKLRFNQYFVESLSDLVGNQGSHGNCWAFALTAIHLYRHCLTKKSLLEVNDASNFKVQFKTLLKDADSAPYRQIFIWLLLNLCIIGCQNGIAVSGDRRIDNFQCVSDDRATDGVFMLGVAIGQSNLNHAIFATRVESSEASNEHQARCHVWNSWKACPGHAIPRLSDYTENYAIYHAKPPEHVTFKDKHTTARYKLSSVWPSAKKESTTATSYYEMIKHLLVNDFRSLSDHRDLLTWLTSNWDCLSSSFKQHVCARLLVDSKGDTSHNRKQLVDFICEQKSIFFSQLTQSLDRGSASQMKQIRSEYLLDKLNDIKLTSSHDIDAKYLIELYSGERNNIKHDLIKVLMWKALPICASYKGFFHAVVHFFAAIACSLDSVDLAVAEKRVIGIFQKNASQGAVVDQAQLSLSGSA